MLILLAIFDYSNIYVIEITYKNYDIKIHKLNLIFFLIKKILVITSYYFY